MKKKYIKPEMEVYEMEPQQLLAGSPDLYNNGLPSDGNEGMW